MTSALPGWDAVVLAGGAARRMGGDDKLMLDVGGRPLLARVVAAAAGATRVVVVGPRRPVPADVVWCCEEPVGGGPAAAVAAALPHLLSPVAVLLAGDLPLLDPATVAQLVAALGDDDDGAVAVDHDTRPQWLCSAWRVRALRAAPLAPGGSLRDALTTLRWTPVTLDAGCTLDCDTPDDLRRVRELTT